MEQAEQTMLDNLHKNTGKSLDEWVTLLRKENFQKHGEILKHLKENHGFTHGFANLVAHKTLKSDAGSADNQEELVQKQYKGKEQFWPIYQKLTTEIAAFGSDVEFAPKISYVSVKRKKQFALLSPVTKTRFEIGINLKGQAPQGILESETKSNAMCSHKIVINHEEQINSEVISWLKKAFESAG
ncbi:DUF4287 domain-containing protein [Algoriphagus litoralis]|uniref:DUF4287 domain-containing protein n=1 Tax=Algoriphagus litoralis TaxID=2202829 RepID=UPI000DB9D15F|nr:DUF4287 domain-containing protein [Algoriphagus litoralis]